MATQIGSGTGLLATYIPDLADTANIQTALKQLYYGTTNATLSTSTGVYGALYQIFSGTPTFAGSPTFSGSVLFSDTDAVTLASTTHAIQIGPTASVNLAMSPAIIQGRNNGAASALSINSLGGNITLGNSSSTVTITGDLIVSGNTTTLNTATLDVEDIEITLGNVASPSNTTANGGGIRLEAGLDVDKTITWDSTNANWTTSENWNIATGKTLKINNVNIASGTGAALVLGANASTSLAIGNTAGTTTINGTLAVNNPNRTMAYLMGYTSTVTAGGTTTLDNTSSYYQQFTGTSNQTVVLPVTTSNFSTGWTFHIVNNSTGTITVQASDTSAVITVPSTTTAMVTCISTGVTSNAAWESGITDFSGYTGSGNVVMATSPTFATSIIGSASMDVFNTVSSTLNIGAAATTLSIGHNTATKTLNIGTLGTTATTTTINIGSAVGTTAVSNISLSGKISRPSTSQNVSSWTTSGQAFDIAAATFTDTSGAGTIAQRVVNSFNTPTLAASTSVTLTDAANVYISAAPTASTNTTITNGHALWVGGQTRIDGNIVTGSASVNLLNTTATTLSIGGAATTFTLGSTTAGTTTVQAGTTLNLNAPTIATNVTSGTLALFNTGLTGTLNFAGAATTIAVGNTTTAAQTVNIGTASTGASTYNIGTGATVSGTIKTVAVGGSGASGSITNVTVGSVVSGSINRVITPNTLHTSSTTNTGTSVTLTAAMMLTKNVIQTTATTAVTYTLDTGTNLDGSTTTGFNTPAVGTTIEWNLFNDATVSGAITIGGGTNHTYSGNATVAIATMAKFLTRKTAANTYITTRIF